LILSNTNTEKHNATTLLSIFFPYQHNFSAKSKLQRNSNRNCAHLPSALSLDLPETQTAAVTLRLSGFEKRMAEFPIPEFLDIPGLQNKKVRETLVYTAPISAHLRHLTTQLLCRGWLGNN